MRDLGIAVDGGKDSLSMAVKVKADPSQHRHPSKDNKDNKESEIVKSPGTLVISAYAPVPDVRVKVTPEVKKPGSSLIHIDFSGRRKLKARCGASALAQVFSQVGNEVPDIDSAEELKKGFNLIQSLVKGRLCISGHDISDGGLVTCILEMAFAGNYGLEIDLKTWSPDDTVMEFLFAEEAGVVIEVLPDKVSDVESILKRESLDYQIVGRVLSEDAIRVKVNGSSVIQVRRFLGLAFLYFIVRRCPSNLIVCIIVSICSR